MLGDFALFDTSSLTQFSKFNNFLWVCWFLGKNLSNFVPPIWKLHNPYCNTLHLYNKGWCLFFCLSTGQMLNRLPVLTLWETQGYIWPYGGCLISHPNTVKIPYFTILIGLTSMKKCMEASGNYFSSMYCIIIEIALKIKVHLLCYCFCLN